MSDIQVTLYYMLFVIFVYAWIIEEKSLLF